MTAHSPGLGSNILATQRQLGRRQVAQPEPNRDECRGLLIAKIDPLARQAFELAEKLRDYRGRRRPWMLPCADGHKRIETQADLEPVLKQLETERRSICAQIQALLDEADPALAEDHFMKDCRERFAIV